MGSSLITRGPPDPPPAARSGAQGALRTHTLRWPACMLLPLLKKRPRVDPAAANAILWRVWSLAHRAPLVAAVFAW